MVYIATKGKKYYHTKACKLQGKDKKAIHINDAISENYKACKFCRPFSERKETHRNQQSFSNLKEKSQTVYVATEGKKYFHTKACKLQGKDKKAIHVNDAISESYKACKFCKPFNGRIEEQQNERSFSILEEESQTVYIAKKGKKYFHTKSCRLQGKHKKAIEIHDAISRNYKVCKFCKPTKNTQRLNHSIPSENNRKRKKKNNSSSSSGKRYSVRCSGTTRKGTRCKRKTNNSSGRCYQH